ncbi:hypothetical protein WH47_00350 [Habropoda laboriosa]|uniref:Uncharacterized protein n=1 Tax=Habropoda laboriosa TaxID=597456 RepID=A0A0L7R1W7_9HYME|nr:hypothetical protein WH47_00350 [Habropoda laboriosa]
MDTVVRLEGKRSQVTGHISPVVKVHRQRWRVVNVLKPSQNTNRLVTIRRSTIGAGQKPAVSSKKDE